MGAVQKIAEAAGPLTYRAALALPSVDTHGGRVERFTHHPWILRHLGRLKLRPGTFRFLELLVVVADKEGVTWYRLEELVAQMPRSSEVGQGARRSFSETYSVVTGRRAARELRALGLLSWDVILPLHRFPGRVGGKRVPNMGGFTQSGGRVFRVELEALRQALTQAMAPGYGLARKVEGRSRLDRPGAITSDRPGAITSDRPSDPSSPKTLTKEITPAGGSAGAHAPAGHRVDAAAPRARVASDEAANGHRHGSAERSTGPGREERNEGEERESSQEAPSREMLARMPPALRSSFLTWLGALSDPTSGEHRA